MVFKKTGKLHFYMKIIGLIGVIIRVVISSSEESSEDKELDWYDIRKPSKTPSSIAIEDKDKPITQKRINRHVYNQEIYNFSLINYSRYNIVFRKISMFSIHELKAESIILIKNLIDPNIQDASWETMKPIQVGRDLFTHKWPAVNINLDVYLKQDINILITHYDLGQKIKKLQEVVKKDLEKMDTDRKSTSIAVIFVESIIYLLAEYLHKRNPALVKIDEIVNSLFHNYKNYYRINVDSKKLNMETFRIEYLLHAWNAYAQIDELIQNTDDMIDKYNKEQKEKGEEKKCIGKEEKEKIGWINFDFLPNIRSYLEQPTLNPSGKLYYMNDSRFIKLMAVFEYIIIIVEKDSFRKDQIYQSIIKEFASAVKKEVCNLRNISSSDIYNSNKVISEIVEECKLRVFSCMIEILNKYEKKGKITYTTDPFEEIIMKIIEFLLYFETEVELDDTSKSLANCIGCARNNLQNMSFALSLKNLRDLLDGFFSNLASDIERVITVKKNGEIEINENEIDQGVFNRIYTYYNDYLRGLHSTITRVRENDLLWDNPAFLHYIISEDQQVQKDTVYIIYMNSKTKKLCKKEIKNSLKSIKDFSNAKTYKDIISMGRMRSKAISIEDLFKLENNEFSVISKRNSQFEINISHLIKCRN